MWRRRGVAEIIPPGTGTHRGGPKSHLRLSPAWNWASSVYKLRLRRDFRPEKEATELLPPDDRLWKKRLMDRIKSAKAQNEKIQKQNFKEELALEFSPRVALSWFQKENGGRNLPRDSSPTWFFLISASDRSFRSPANHPARCWCLSLFIF